MKVIKPSWVLHNDDKERSQSIFTIAVHPDGSRVATGGLDTKIKIWSTSPVLVPALGDPENHKAGDDEDAQKNEENRKLLCTMTSHSGVVMCVRWSNSGKFLASGSDDKIVMIWNLETGLGGKVWGSADTNIENWKAVRRLVGHDSDVAGVAWAPDDLYLASVGLDSTVLVWSGTTFEMLRRLDGHQGFVKGVVFDPVGQFLATQSDDNTVKIWRTDDWRLHADIKAPFKSSPKTNIMRLTWSPEGTHVVTPNSMNGPVFVAAVIDRFDWRSKNSMVGHENIVDVAAFSPIIFLRDERVPPIGANLCTLLALSARNSISLWVTSQNKPVVVLDEVFDRDVLDLSWSVDGTQLWSCSSEGHVAVFTFDLAEIGIVAPPGTRENHHSTYGFVKRAPVPVPGAANFNGNASVGTIARPNTLIARKGPNAKRRPEVRPPQPVPMLQQQSAQIHPHVISQQPTTIMRPNPAETHQSHQMMGQQYQHMLGQPLPAQQYYSPYLPQHVLQASHRSPDRPSLQAHAFAQANAAAPVLSQPLPPGHLGVQMSPGEDLHRKRRISQLSDVIDHDVSYSSENHHRLGPAPAPRLSEAPYRSRGRTLGEDQTREALIELRELKPLYVPQSRDLSFAVSNREKASVNGTHEEDNHRVLAVPAIKSYGKLQVEDSDAKDTLEWRNLTHGSSAGTSEVAVLTSNKLLWVDYLPKHVICATGSPQFTSVSTEDGSLFAYSPTGRRLLPTLVLDSPCSFLEAEGPFLMAITALGTLHVWNVVSGKAVCSPLTLTSLLSSSAKPSMKYPTITTSALLPNGTPLISLSSGTTHCYDIDLQAWSRLSETWWSKGSDYWESRRGGKMNAMPGRGAIRSIESAVNEVVVELEPSSNEESSSAAHSDNAVEIAEEVTEADESGRVKKRRVNTTESETTEQTKLGSNETFRTALSLGHLEIRMKAAVALDSPGEYKGFMIAYAKRLAEEGFRGKAEELVKELLGPIYFKPGKQDDWAPSIVGLNKREILREILPTFAKSRMLGTLGTEYQEILKKITNA